MIKEDIGYIICESNITGLETTNVLKDDNGHAIGEGILQTANEKNRNGRFYPSEELFPQLKAPRTLELLEAGYLRAELGHPLSNELVRQQTIDDSRTCAQFLKLWIDGDNVWARFRGTNNAFGEAFNKDLLDGCKPAWSLRALGSIKNTSRGAEVHNLKVITWDQVIYPSHPGAYTHRVLTEAATGQPLTNLQKIALEHTEDGTDSGIITPISNKQVIDYIKSESANFKYVKENFDFMYDNIKVDRELQRVILTCKNGDILNVNVEQYIGDEIRNYASRMNYLSE